MIVKIRTLLAVGGLLLACAAKANPIFVNEMGEGSSYSLGLQSIINDRGNTLVNVDSDQVDSGTAASWTASGSVPASMVLEIAGSADVNSFGIYNLADPSQKTEVFAGAATGGATTSFTSPYASFGFYLINGALGFTWYSDHNLNGGQDHMVAFQGKGETLNLGNDAASPVGSTVWDSNTYLLAWEDQDLDSSDHDYNDMLVLVNFAPTSQVPDVFSTMGLLSMAMAGMIFFQQASLNQRKQQLKPLPAKNSPSARL